MTDTERLYLSLRAFDPKSWSLHVLAT